MILHQYYLSRHIPKQTIIYTKNTLHSNIKQIVIWKIETIVAKNDITYQESIDPLYQINYRLVK